MTPEIVNIVLTLILIAVYLFNTRSQNNKINTQSTIINDLKEQVKFFDIQKIKDYVELRDVEKDKLLKLTRDTIEKEFELKNKNDSQQSFAKTISQKQVSELTKGIITEFVTEPYMYVVLDLMTKPEGEALKLIDSYFPKNKENVLSLYNDMRSTFIKQYGTSDLYKIKEQMVKNNYRQQNVSAMLR